MNSRTGYKIGMLMDRQIDIDLSRYSNKDQDLADWGKKDPGLQLVE